METQQIQFKNYKILENDPNNTPHNNHIIEQLNQINFPKIIEENDLE